ncbi:hypothetical protein [Agrobacterium vitis]|uniref:hypothetical protein n=1 Tax=Agrobacterium vitis TaxID=373 RepID=UPI00115FF3A5|nr:hypothetical protein [Agrobacterium vitis]MUO85554.1 hypothetical protein [Agrobacterium vitis]
MKIVNRTEFLTMAAGTVFMKFPAQPKDGSYVDLGFDEAIAIKDETIGNDFIVQHILPCFESEANTEDWFNIMSQMLGGERSPPVDYNVAGRDGLFDDDQLFLVWEKDDLERMIARLNQALLAGYQCGGRVVDANEKSQNVTAILERKVELAKQKNAKSFLLVIEDCNGKLTSSAVIAKGSNMRGAIDLVHSHLAIAALTPY